MAKFILKSKINALLKNSGKPPIVEILFLGTGGAFDALEKNSSAIIKTAAGTILIDCGSTTYSELKARNLIDSIDYIFITHCHEDHIGSLSTLVYHKYFDKKNQIAKIECIPSLKSKIETYLKDVCGHMEDSYIINSNPNVLYKNLNMIIHKIDTTNYHYKDFPSAGFVFNFRKNKEDLFLIYSGDVNVPITEIISKTDLKLYESLIKVPENVFIFHESTYKDLSPFYPHCEYQKLEELTNTFPNIFLYHNSQKEIKGIFKEMKNSKIKLESIKKAIDLDLDRKLSLVKKHETKEKLRIQAKRLKDEFAEDFEKVSLKTKNLNIIGKELIIHEEMEL